jgi:hypothetical protein
MSKTFEVNTILKTGHIVVGNSGSVFNMILNSRKYYCEKDICLKFYKEIDILTKEDNSRYFNIRTAYPKCPNCFQRTESEFSSYYSKFCNEKCLTNYKLEAINTEEYLND